MTDEQLMEKAIEQAHKSNEPLKCGAVIAKNGDILAKAFNSQRDSNDATAHAEIKAIRGAAQLLGNKNLTDCVIYCTSEPRVMCLGAIAFADIRKIVIGSTLSEITSDDNHIDIDVDYFVSKLPRKIEVIKGFLKGECDKINKV
ncbi:Deaminase [sediment metagenome]|uniref:Deaminase n=1 Tax=sediment metagenome TaxID=749907 RepID=D9PJS9_9ZZZZ